MSELTISRKKKFNEIQKEWAAFYALPIKHAVVWLREKTGKDFFDIGEICGGFTHQWAMDLYNQAKREGIEAPDLDKLREPRKEERNAKLRGGEKK